MNGVLNEFRQLLPPAKVECVDTFRAAASVSEKRSSRSSASAPASLRCRKRATSARFSRPLRISSTAANCPVRLMDCRTGEDAAPVPGRSPRRAALPTLRTTSASLGRGSRALGETGLVVHLRRACVVRRRRPPAPAAVPRRRVLRLSPPTARCRSSSRPLSALGRPGRRASGTASSSFSPRRTSFVALLAGLSIDLFWVPGQLVLVVACIIASATHKRRATGVRTVHHLRPARIKDCFNPVFRATRREAKSVGARTEPTL